MQYGPLRLLSPVPILAIVCLAGAWAPRSMAARIYLSGTGPADAVAWEFLCSDGRKSGEWSTLPVPSNWEQHGFGGYDYGHVPPQEKHHETGRYRVRFFAPMAWKDQVVRLVFEGSMTDTSVKVNGIPIGPVHQGGYDQFHFLLTDTGKYGQHAIKPGAENELEVLVAKRSSNPSLEAAERTADYWVFGGIYRPVYLEVLPKIFVNRVAIDARADGHFRIDIFPQVHLPRNSAGGDHIDEVVAQIETLDGAPVGSPMTVAVMGGGTARARLQTQIKAPALWSPEFPHRYQVRVSLKREGATQHEIVERFGFRTVEVRMKDGLYLNGSKILVRGVNRNTFRPDSARAIDPEQAWEDARSIKAMNANAVRCHIPPSTAFMEACDELGLLFVVERTNWQRPVTDTPLARQVVHDLVTRLHNHPSLVMWANGNESGFNHEVDELFALLDLQGRPVIHPWAKFDGIDTRHYLGYGDLKNRLAKQPNVLLPTELLHGLYDGGLGAGLEDYWDVMRAAPLSAGCFLWCWADAAIERTDQNRRLDTDGNHSADGIVGPYGEREGSYYTIREIWSPLQIPAEDLPGSFDGLLPIENRFDETWLNQCVFRWRLVNYSEPFSDRAESRVVAEGTLKGPAVAPGEVGALHIPLPIGWQKCGGLELEAIAPSGTEIMSWSWAVAGTRQAEGDPSVVPEQVQADSFQVRMGDALWSFCPDTGRVLGCVKNGVDCGLGLGPVLYAGTSQGAHTFSHAWKARVASEADAVVIDSDDGNGSRFRWKLAGNGEVSLEYEFAEMGEALTYCAVGFELDEELVASKRWMGDGPHRVWANRRKGPQYGLWETEYNDGITGVNWVYPEFRGVFGNIDWMRIDLRSGAQILVDTNPGAMVGVLRPKNAESDKAVSPRTAVWESPDQGGLFLYHAVPAIGTKFKDAAALGPQSRPKVLPGPVRGAVRFRMAMKR